MPTRIRHVKMNKYIQKHSKNETNEDREHRYQPVHGQEQAERIPLKFESGLYKMPRHGKHIGDIHKV